MKFIEKNRKKINIAINVLTIALLLSAIIPFFLTIKYALFITDDYPIVNAVVSKYDGSYFRTGIKCAASYWHDWNGNWFSFAIAYWLHPLVHGGQKVLAFALRIQFALTIVGAVYFCFSLVSLFDFKPEKTIRLIALLVLPILCFKEYFDFYLWWLTSCTYLMPLYLFLFGSGTFLLALKNKKMWIFIISGIFLLAMSGGSLNVVGMGCYFLLFTLIAWMFYKKKISIPSIVVFMVTLTGACINAFAPGNFMRQNSQETEKVGIVKTVFNEIQIIGVEGKWLVLHTAFIAVVLIAFVWGMNQKRKIDILNLAVATVGATMLPIVTMFPVVLGYGDINYKDISNRGYGMMDISIIFASCFIAVLWGIYCRNLAKEKTRNGVTIAICFVVIINIIICGQKPSEIIPVQIATNLKSGYNENFYEQWMEIYSRCENSNEDDVVIEMSVSPRRAGCSWAKLGEDPNKWWNETVSIYYGINSVSLINTYE